MESYIENTHNQLNKTKQKEQTKQKKDTLILAKVHGLFNMWNYVLPSNELILDSDKVFFFRWGWLDIVVFRFSSIFLLPSLFSPSLCLLFSVSVHKRANFRLSLRDLRWLSHLFAYNLHAEVFIQDFHLFFFKEELFGKFWEMEGRVCKIILKWPTAAFSKLNIKLE